MQTGADLLLAMDLLSIAVKRYMSTLDAPTRAGSTGHRALCDAAWDDAGYCIDAPDRIAAGSHETDDPNDWSDEPCDRQALPTYVFREGLT